jgi:hypothetical protein
MPYQSNFLKHKEDLRGVKKYKKNMQMKIIITQ